MIEDLEVTALTSEDRPYAISSWRESHHQAPKIDKLPWSFYKREYGTLFQRIMKDDGTLALGAYRKGELLGFLIATPGRRVDTLHWVQTKFKDKAGERVRRRGVMTALIDAASLGDKFVYTLRARKEGSTTLDEVLAKKLQERGITAAYISLMEWIK